MTMATPTPAQVPTPTRGRLRVEIHQLEGFDRRDKSFNRNVEIWRTAQGYVAYFQYEGLELQTAPALRPAEALKALVSAMHRRGVSNIRTRLNFKGNRYLAERLPWVSHPAAP
ncbi:MAG: hypothetical protein HY208_02105 [Nitrospirae bacterium]|nr:hypothetical protein [Nitrospirota bacterium]